MPYTKHLEFDRSINPSGQVRVSGIGQSDGTIRIDPITGEAIIEYRVASLKGGCSFPDKDYAPWIHVRLHEDKRVVATIHQAALASVEDKGGYQNHRTTFLTGLTQTEIEDLTHATIFMGGSNPLC